MKCSHKLLSLILTICTAVSMMLTGFIPTNAVSENKAAGSETFELPDIVDSTEAKENDYVGRVEAEEKDLYTFVFANGDGTNTMRVYSHPVKYIADDNSVRDISLDIKAKKDGGFVTADHEIVTTFENKLADGITLEYNDVEIMLVPTLDMDAMPAAELSTDGKVVTYEIDDITSFVYKLTYAGFKEDIVVEEYTGQTEYEFTLFTDGLTLREEYGSYYLADAEGNIKALIGDIIVFTADERNNTIGSITYETVRANQEYILTIHLDAEYLADKDTIYPIRIDPTIEINYDNNGAGAIEDVTINQSTTFSGTLGSLYVGRNPVGSLSRILMRFPKLSLSGIQADLISSATVELRDLMCQSDEDITVECYMYSNTAPTWSESGTTTWTSVGSSYIGTFLDSKLISFGKGNVEGQRHRYAFNITPAVKSWANSSNSPQKGIVFKANNSFENQTGSNIKTWYKTFSSYNRVGEYSPSLSISYRCKINVSVDVAYLFIGGTKQVNCSTNPPGLNVTWESTDISIATVSDSGLVTGISEGLVKIIATYKDNSTGTTSSDYVYLYVNDSVGLEDNTNYYVMNYNSCRYLSLEVASDTNLTNVYTRERSSSNLSQWKTEKQTDGTFQLISVYSQTKKVLDKTGTNIDIYTDSNSSYQKFGITRIDSGTYKGLYYIRHGNYYVAQDSNYNVYLTLALSSNAIWSFMAVNTRYANYYSIESPNTNGRYNDYRSVMNSLGYTSNNLHCVSANNAYYGMRKSNDIFTYIGHGLETVSGQGMATICFTDSSGGYNGYITANNAIVNGSKDYAIDDMDRNELALERCVLYLGCNTGQTYTINGKSYNLVQSTYNKGAHFVLGTLEEITVSEAYSFLDTFLNNCSKGNIYDSISSILEDNRIFDAFYMGDSSQFINVK